MKNVFIISFVVIAYGQTLLGTGNPGGFSSDFSLILISILGMIYGPVFGFWIGCTGGLFHDLLSSPAPIGLFALGGALIGWISGVLWRWTVRTRWGVAGLLIGILTICHAFLIQLLLWVGGTVVRWPPIEQLAWTFLYVSIISGLFYAVLAAVIQRRSS